MHCHNNFTFSIGSTIEKKDPFGQKMPFYVKQIPADSVIVFIYNKFHFGVSLLFRK